MSPAAHAVFEICLAVACWFSLIGWAYVLDLKAELRRTRMALISVASFDERQGLPCYCDEPDHELNCKTDFQVYHRDWCRQARRILGNE